MEFYGEQGQDKFAYEHCSTPGTFLDVGCWEPVRCNNSFVLEKLAWRGLAIDVDPRWEDIYKKQRTTPFIKGDARTIDWKQICERFSLNPKIDYLSLDVDDQRESLRTVAILQDMIGAGLSFTVITVEHDAYRLGDLVREPVRRLLQANGYTLAVSNVSCRPPDPAWAFEDWFLKE
jgi:hypothetical protein